MANKKLIAKGLRNSKEELVTKDKTALAMGSGLLNVYSTPSMIALMEKTAYTSLEPFLDLDEATVGAEVQIRHLRATPLGMKVTCESCIREVVERKITFSVEAFDEKGKIGEGIHIRYIIDRDRFMNKTLKSN